MKGRAGGHQCRHPRLLPSSATVEGAASLERTTRAGEGGNMALDARGCGEAKLVKDDKNERKKLWGVSG